MPTSAPLLYGYHPVREALRAGRRTIRKVLLAPGKGGGRRQEIAELAQRSGTPVQWIAARELTAMTGHNRHQDIAADASDYPVCSMEEIVPAPGLSGAPWVLLLDHVVDPQNFGAIVRTAHCAGVHGIVAPKDRSAPPTPAASKASAGALEHMRIAYVTNLVAAMQALKRQGYWIGGADRDGQRCVFDVDLKGPLALVIGGEEKGIRPLVQKHCDFTLAIPQAGSVGSLNASAAAAVIIYEAFRQRNSKV
jgi:23S rRNA (guanosine2251-2'-O)-methyltransferase